MAGRHARGGGDIGEAGLRVTFFDHPAAQRIDDIGASFVRFGTRLPTGVGMVAAERRATLPHYLLRGFFGHLLHHKSLNSRKETILAWLVDLAGRLSRTGSASSLHF